MLKGFLPGYKATQRAERQVSTSPHPNTRSHCITIKLLKATENQNNTHFRPFSNAIWKNPENVKKSKPQTILKQT